MKLSTEEFLAAKVGKHDEFQLVAGVPVYLEVGKRRRETMKALRKDPKAKREVVRLCRRGMLVPGWER